MSLRQERNYHTTIRSQCIHNVSTQRPAVDYGKICVNIVIYCELRDILGLIYAFSTYIVLR